MRRIIHNTTAIAACLSLLAPHVAMAQSAAPDETTQEQPPAATDQPAAEAPAAAQDAAAPCEDGQGQPCADAPATADTPADAASEPAQDADMQTEAAAVDPAAAPESEAPENATAPAEAEEPVAQPAPEAEVAAEDVDAATAAGQNDATATEAEAAPAADPQATAEKPADEANDVAAQPEPATPSDEDALADALAKQPDQQQPERQAETPAAEAPAAEATPQGQADTAQPAQNADKATDDDALAKALADEAAQTDAANGTPAAEDKPQADMQTSTDEAPTDTQTQSAPKQQAVTDTEAAKEAAQATEAPTAAALNDEADDAEVTEEQVTEENSRSSDEDFATSLRDTLNAATGQQQAASSGDDDDDDNDLTKAILLGLGGVAVGAMLNNNRQVALSTPDRVVVTRPDGSQQVIKDEVALLRQPGSTVTTENFNDGSSRTIVTRADGSKIVTIRDADLRVLRRTLVAADGTSVPLIDDTSRVAPVDIATLPGPATVSEGTVGQMNEEDLRAALLRETGVDRRFSLAQIRNIPQVRALVAPVNIDAITFDTGSAAIKPDQAKQLSSLGNVMRNAVAENAREMFLIEGHTDAVGSDAANLALSDRRAESVALALTEYFDVPPENMVVQGYGEQSLKVQSEGDVRENRRAAVRRLTDLLQTATD